MQIKQIKTVNKGLKGMNVTLLEEVEKDGYTYLVDDKKKPRWPIHIGLRNAIAELRVHALDLAGYFRGSSDKGVKDYLTQDCQITDIYFGESFKIGFTLKAFDNKSIFVETMEVEKKDGYSAYDEIQEILTRISEEAEAYLSGKVVVSDKQLALMWDEANGGEMKDAIEKMDPKEAKELCTKFLTKQGCIVVHNEEEETEPVEEEKEESEEAA